LIKAIRHFMPALLAAVLCFSVFCTINDDNGSPVDPGNTPVDGGGNGGNGGGGGGNVTLVPIIIAENAYAGLGDTVAVVVTLLADTSRNAAPVSGGRINIASQRPGDWVSNTIVTTLANGQAIVRFSSSDEGTARLTFTYNNTTERGITIEVTDNPPRNITINASPSVLAADGSSKSTITVQVKNNDNNPIVGDVIKFSSNAGLVTAESVTDAEGKATATLTSDRRNTVATVTAALKSDGSRNVKIAVEFSGVTVTATATPTTIKPDGRDSTVILAVLLDAANNPIVGERVTFTRERSTPFSRIDSVTNSRGEARCVVVGNDPGGEWITARAAGADARALITFSTRNLEIFPNGNNSYLAASGQTSTFNVRYTEGNGTIIRGANINVTVTMGMITDPNDIDPASIIFAQRLSTGDDGEITFTINNPLFTGIGTVYVQSDDDDGAPASLQIQFRATEVTRIEITGTPAVIGTNGGKARISATAYDLRGNRVKDAVISFNMLAGPGGGELLDPPIAKTGSDGTASTYLVAGTIPSTFQGVLVTASNYDQVHSDTVKFTMAGPPKNITVRRNIDNITAGTATYSVRLSAIVSDVNNNPVPDGTEVTFSSLVTHYVIWKLVARFRDDPTKGRAYDIDTLAAYEVASEHLNPNRKYRPYPRFYDINRNGRPDRGPDVEPCDPMSPDPTADDCGGGLYADFNGNQKRDLIEPFYDTPEYNVLSGAEIDEMYNVDPFMTAYPPWDLDINNNGVPDPQTALLITRTVLTKNGIADNTLTYGQSDAGKIKVKIWAEAQGLVTSSAEQFILPIAENAKHWNPWD